MLTGAIIGWGILSPYAKYRGWAPGDVGDWDTGSRGWIIWASLASLRADASVKHVWLILRPFWRTCFATVCLQNQLIALREDNVRRQPPRPPQSQYICIPGQAHAELDPSFIQQTQLTSLMPNEYTPLQGESDLWPSSLISLTVLGLGFLLSLLICTLTVHLVFGTIIPWYYTLLAISSVTSNGSGGDKIIGSLFDAFISCVICKLYASQYPIPGPLFRVPSAYLVLSTARLILGRGLSEGVWPFALAAALLSMLSTIVKLPYASRWWQNMIPSGVSVAIGLLTLRPRQCVISC